MDTKERALLAHEQWRGKLEVKTKCRIASAEDLTIAYTPGVAEPCLKIKEDKDLQYKYTGRGNTVAVITDGTAVLGLGDIGPEAGMPVMEGKCALFKTFADIDAIPLCVRSKDVDEIVRTVELIAGSFGGINLEDISAPRCIEIERRLKEKCDIPVFHDDQHGTAVVVSAALLNTCRLTGKKLEDLKVVINGAGAAGLAIARLLLSMKVGDVILCGSRGLLYEGKPDINPEQALLAAMTNKNKVQGRLSDGIVGADVFIGVSVPGTLTAEDVSKMADKAAVFALANPVPEIMPDEAKKGGAYIVGTGRSDYPNQINNVLAFPGIFRGALDVRASDINEEMKMAAARAIADLVSDEELSPEYIMAPSFNPEAHAKVAAAVRQAAVDSGVARI
ncbi:MAG: NADP-dependent malic enzyme [Ruminococcaceae bacterium]|jgi:malate dehydrogenase (oxaloacetate-decarboxylating)|nr:NADP-dependent malic enzyme [Oscillospiraceae bacterium]